MQSESSIIIIDGERFFALPKLMVLLCGQKTQTQDRFYRRIRTLCGAEIPYKIIHWRHKKGASMPVYFIPIDWAGIIIDKFADWVKEQVRLCDVQIHITTKEI